MSTTELMKQAWRGEGAMVAAPRDAEWDFGAWTNPLLGGPFVYVAGVVAYMLSVPWWWIALAGVLFGVSFVGAGLSRGVKRLGMWYTLASSVVATGWLIYAANVLTFNVLDWHATALHAIAGVVVAVPLIVVWGLLVRDAGQAYVDKYLAAQGQVTTRHQWEEATTSAGIKRWSVENVHRTKDFVTATMHIMPGGTTYKEALNRTDALELAVNAAFPGAISLEQPKGAGVATVVIRQALRSTLGEVVPAPEPPQRPRSILEPIVDARFEDGEMSSRIHAYQSAISLGQRDSGKSGLQHTRIDAYAACEDVAIIVIDFKQGSLIRPWLKPFALGEVDRPVFAAAATTPKTLSILLTGLIAIADYRAAHRTGDKITPTPAQPAIRLMIDEVADLLSDSRHQRIATQLVELARKHRSEGIDADLASQRGTMSFLGQWARDLLSQFTIIDLLRVDSAAEVYNALSIPADKLGGVDPTQFEHPGAKLTLARGARKTAARTIRIDDEAIPARSATYSAWRPQIEPGAVAAADKATKGQFSKLLNYDTDEARDILRTTATLAGDEDAAQHWAGPANSSIDTGSDGDDNHDDGGEPVLAPAASTAVSSMRDMLIATHGEVEGAQKWEAAQGRMILSVAQLELATRGDDYILTSDLLDVLAHQNPARWAELTARQLATFVGHWDVKPTQNLGPQKQRGYMKEDIDASFEM